MNTPPDSTQPIAGDDKLVFEFFATFSRFECALKRAGFVKRGPCGSASPDWEEFAKSLNGKLAPIGCGFYKRQIVFASKTSSAANACGRQDANPKRKGESDPVIKPRKESMIVCDGTDVYGLSPTKTLMDKVATCIQKLTRRFRAVRNPNEPK